MPVFSRRSLQKHRHTDEDSLDDHTRPHLHALLLACRRNHLFSIVFGSTPSGGLTFWFHTASFDTALYSISKTIYVPTQFLENSLRQHNALRRGSHRNVGAPWNICLLVLRRICLARRPKNKDNLWIFPFGPPVSHTRFHNDLLLLENFAEGEQIIFAKLYLLSKL